MQIKTDGWIDERMPLKEHAPAIGPTFGFTAKTLTPIALNASAVAVAPSPLTASRTSVLPTASAGTRHVACVELMTLARVDETAPNLHVAPIPTRVRSGVKPAPAAMALQGWGCVT